MKVKVNKDVCIGCGACEAIVPDVFQIQEEGTACVIGSVKEEIENDVIDAKESCPTGAIEIEK